MLAQHVEQGLWCPWLFAGVDHEPPHQHTVGYRWLSTLARAGVEGIRLHDLRHFFASGLIASGCDVVAAYPCVACGADSPGVVPETSPPSPRAHDPKDRFN